MTASYIAEPAFLAEDPHKLAKTDLTKCTLLMNVGPALLMFAVYEPQNKYLITLKGYFFDIHDQEGSLLETLEQCFDQNRILYTAFQDIKISFDNHEFTLIPDELYDPSLKKEYLTFLHPESAGQSFQTDRIEFLNAVNVYAVDKNTAGYLRKEFGSAKFYHAETAFLSSVMQEADNAATRLYVRVQQGHITITVIVEGKLKLVQPYPIYHGMDVYYFVLNTVKSLHLNDRHVEVFLSGQINEESSVYKELIYGIPSVSWLKRPKNITYSRDFNKYPDQYFYILASLAQCE
ncbi:MAG: DUF3822 family protein [Chitinophagaceae bacterium]|nr:MAG: DUF3822 family protein [Chitinophagaceae bacterium]